MKVLIDMNLSPSWVQALEDHGFPALHWSSVGDGGVPDAVVLGWAKENGYVVFTNDLDFGAILATTRAAAPSVIQVRTQDLSPTLDRHHRARTPAARGRFGTRRADHYR